MPAYTLYNLSIGEDVTNKGKTIFSIYVSADNVLVLAFQSHLSRLKYTSENYATGRMGIYDMGRNISFKMIVPFGISKMKQD
jgi:iron complex outermembrane recepter protein